MRGFDKIMLAYFIVCVILCGLFALFGYELNGTHSDLPKAIRYFCFYMLWLLTPYVIIYLIVDIIKNFKLWKLINLILMLFYICILLLNF